MLRIRRLLLCCAFLGLVPTSYATDLLLNPGSGSTNTSSHNNTLGYDFTVGANPLLVTALGAYRYQGFSSTDVGLWDTLGNLLTMATVLDPGGPGSFAFANLNVPVLLLPGQTYVLGVHDPVGAGLVINGFGQTAFDGSNVTVNEDRFVIGSGFAFPGTSDGMTESYVGPNARYTVEAVPEPASLLLIVVGGAAVILKRRLRRS